MAKYAKQDIHDMQPEIEKGAKNREPMALGSDERVAAMKKTCQPFVDFPKKFMVRRSRTAQIFRAPDIPPTNGSRPAGMYIPCLLSPRGSYRFSSAASQIEGSCKQLNKSLTMTATWKPSRNWKAKAASICAYWNASLHFFHQSPSDLIVLTYYFNS